MLEQRRVALQRRGEERLARDEQHDELGGVRQGLPVRLVGERVDVLAQVLGVGLHPRLAEGGVGGLGRLEVGGEGDLGVDDDAAAPGEPDDEVGAQRAAVGSSYGRLLVEVAPIEHAGVLHDAAQLHLAPLPAGLRPAQRVDQ